MHAASPENDSHDNDNGKREIRRPELGPALKRDRLLQRVRAAKKRLTAAPGTITKLS